MIFTPKEKKITFDESIDFFRTVKYKTPIISVMRKLKDEKVSFFMAKDDEVSILLSSDLKKIDVVPTAGDTYFVVNSIHNRKTYNVFKLDSGLFNVVVGRD
jgi:hypothetical protein